MSWIWLIAAQGFLPAPMPAEAHPALDRYSSCLSEQLDRDERLDVGPADFPQIMDEALLACRAVRDRSIEQADAAIAGVRGFEDARHRRSFLTGRLDWIDELFREIARGEGDPDDYAAD